jgi:hypothetical protein
MLSVLDICNQEIQTNKQTDDDDKYDTLDSTSTSTINNGNGTDKVMEVNLCNLAQSLLQEILDNTRTDPVGAIEGLLKLSGWLRMPDKRQDFLWYPKVKTCTWRRKSLKLVSHHS